MTRTETRGDTPSKLRFPRWFAVVTTPIGFVIVHVGFPWGISLLTTHHGWIGVHPGVWNIPALVLTATGAVVVLWGAGMHVARTPDRFDIQATPAFLLLGGPYRFCRNPIYVGVLTMWLGWTLFYGSISVAVAFVIIWAIVTFVVVPWEERQLEARFGDSYLRYKGTVPRWSGRRVADSRSHR